MDRCEVGEAGRSLGIAVSSRPCDFPDVNGMLRLTPRRVKNLPLFYSDRNCSALYVQWSTKYIHPLVVLGDGITRFALHMCKGTLSMG